MPILFDGNSSPGGGGGGLLLRDPPDIFTGANLAACITARNTYFNAVANAEALNEFQASQFLAIILDPAGDDNSVWQTYAPGETGNAYNAARWLDRSSVIMGDRGPGPTDAQVTAVITKAFILNRLGLTAQQLEDIFVDAVKDGTNIVITQADGSTIRLPVGSSSSGGDSGGDQPVSYPTLFFGTSIDRDPVAGELTIEGVEGAGQINAYSGGRYILVARLGSEGDLTNITRSDDGSNTNQFGAFAKHGSTVTKNGSAYNVWVSNQALSQPANVTWSAS